MAQKDKILILYSGGTIGMFKNREGFLQPFDVNYLIQEVPQLDKLDCQIDFKSIEKPKDSADFSTCDWIEIGELIYSNYHAYEGFVVLHGTDTMAYTASALSFMFSGLKKPVIFTGSQLPISHVRTDACENLLSSVQIALLKTNEVSIVQEVCVFFGNKLLRANCSTKSSSSDFVAFESYNYPHLISAGVDLKVQHEYLWDAASENSFSFDSRLSSQVFVFKMYPGVNLIYFEKLVKTISFRVLVLETYGSGTFLQDARFIDLLKWLKSQNKVVVNVTQCLKGGVVEGTYKTNSNFKDLGMISAGRMTFEAVITKCMVLLGRGLSKNEFVNNFLISLSGERD